MSKSWLHWTSAEIEILKKNYSTMSVKQLSDEMLPGRSVQAIYQKANLVGVARINWTPEDDEFLRKHIPIWGASICAKRLPGRTLAAVQARVKKLGLVCPAGSPQHKKDNQAINWALRGGTLT